MPRKPYIVPFYYVDGAVENEIPRVQRRIEVLTGALDAFTPPSSSHRMRMVALAWFLESSVLLSSLGHNGPAIMELHSWLECFALRESPKRLAGSPGERTREHVGTLDDDAGRLACHCSGRTGRPLHSPSRFLLNGSIVSRTSKGAA